MHSFNNANIANIIFRVISVPNARQLITHAVFTNPMIMEKEFV